MPGHAGPSTLNSYRAIRALGHGDMGAVFLALHLDTETSFAIKVMCKAALSKRHNSQRSATELDILSMLNHPFLPVLHDHFETEKYKVLVLDFCSGRDLNVLRHKQPEKKFSEAAVRFYAAEVVLALEHLHGLGIAYRDLKPENILVQSNGHIMLADFDLSIKLPPATPRKAGKKGSYYQMWSCASGKYEDGVHTSVTPVCMSPKVFKSQRSKSQQGSTRVTPVEAGKKGQAFSFVGTAEYIAPEVLLGTGHDFSVDWWTLGVLLYEMFYGKTPFSGATRKDTFVNIVSREPHFPGPWSPLHDLVRKLLAKQPEKRLGYRQGAVEIKKHMFFGGVRWNMLEHVTRPPFVPPPVSVESMIDEKLNLEDYLAAMDRARSEKDKLKNSKPKPSNNHQQVSSMNVEAFSDF